MKRYRLFSLMLSAAMTFGCVTAEIPAAAAADSAAEYQTVRFLDEEGKMGWFYEYGCAGDPSAMQVSSSDYTTLKASWENVTAPMVSAGYSTIELNREDESGILWNLRSIQELSYRGQFRVNFETVFGVHGWLSEPRAEFFIVEGYVSSGRLFPTDPESSCGTVTLKNGESYRIYRLEKTGKTPFADSETYLQYWSVRDYEAARAVASSSGFQIDTPLNNHFSAWAMLGMEIGICEQADVRLYCDPDMDFPDTAYLNIQRLDTKSYCSSEFTVENADGETVTGLRPGDMNADGKLTREDLLRYGVILSDFFDKHMTRMEQCAADMNGDMKIDARDKTLLKRALLAQQQTEQPPSSERKLLFSDEFDGSAVDLTKWSYDLGNWKLDQNGNYVTNGWGNDEQQFYTDKNASVSGGVLTIAARHEAYTDEKQGSYEYTSAKLLTAQKFSTTGGRIEVRARCDAGKSLWPAIWMLPEEELYGGWAASGEIDIMEGWGSKPEKICGTIHFGGTWPNNQHLTADYNFPAGTSAADWHVYAVEWKKNCIEWYVDDQLYSTQTEWSSDGYDRPAPFDQDFYLILNLAVGGKFDGVDDVKGDPSIFADGEKQFQIDYVRVYEPAEDFTRTTWASLPLELYTEGADAELHNSDTGTAVAVRSTGEKEYAVMALRRGLEVRAGTTYNVLFDASCDRTRDMIVTVEDSAYNRLLEQKISLTPDEKHYALAVTFPSDMQADLKFQLGSIGDSAGIGAHAVTLSNVRFQPE